MLELLLGSVCMIGIMIVKFLPVWLMLAIIIGIPLLLFQHIGIPLSILVGVLLMIICIKIFITLINYFSSNKHQ